MTSTTNTIVLVLLILAVSEHASATCPAWNDTNAVVVESPAGDKCYLLPAGHNRGVWSSACALCWMYAYTSLGGGHLPFIANAFENAFVRNLTTHAPMDVGEYLWLGGEWVRGKYRWQDGTALHLHQLGAR
ncbi:hypothetical protein AAVH_13954 [Aphelenchoides avenae]|nr:hypothetical protein AAVH_13954 [Aphelenchus avenae]